MLAAPPTGGIQAAARAANYKPISLSGGAARRCAGPRRLSPYSKPVWTILGLRLPKWPTSWVGAPASSCPLRSEARGSATHAAPVPRLQAMPPTPSTTLLPARDAKVRLREIIEGFSFRRLKSTDGKRIGRQLVKSPPGLGKTREAIH